MPTLTTRSQPFIAAGPPLSTSAEQRARVLAARRPVLGGGAPAPLSPDGDRDGFAGADRCPGERPAGDAAGGRRPGTGIAPDDGQAGFAPAVPAAGQLAIDALETDALGALPRMGSAGLCVPRLRPETPLSVLLPTDRLRGPLSAEVLTGALVGQQAPSPTGKRKSAPTFRAPGQRGGQINNTGGHLIMGDDDRSATYHARGQTVTSPLTEDGAAAMADALLSEGILQEADWCGSLERSIRRGLSRWANGDKGAGAWQFLGSPLSLVYTDDGPAYSTGVRLPRWQQHFRARPDRPIGFFGLRYQSPPRAVHVRTVTQGLEAAWPGVGYGVLNLLEMTFISAVAGYGFMWGKSIAARWGMLDMMDSPDFLTCSPDELEYVMDGNHDKFRFGASVPKAAYETPFRLALLEQAWHEAARDADLFPVLDAALGVFRTCRRAGTTFHTLNHCPMLSWQMTMARRGQSGVQTMPIERLNRTPVVYTVWDAADDPMTRLVDDYTEYARSTMQYTDLTWMHGFQLDFAGREPDAARKHLAAHERMVQQRAKRAPETLAFIDPGYVAAPMIDGSVTHAAKALMLVMDILGALDRLLSLLHTPETLAEQERAGGL